MCEGLVVYSVNNSFETMAVRVSLPEAPMACFQPTGCTSGHHYHTQPWGKESHPCADGGLEESNRLDLV